MFWIFFQPKAPRLFPREHFSRSADHSLWTVCHSAYFRAAWPTCACAPPNRSYRELNVVCSTAYPLREPNADEQLFYTSEVSIQAHFERLNKLGIEQMTYANHEAVPTREEVKDYFREVDLFRMNHLVLPLSRNVGEGTRFWRRRRKHGQYMLAYDNGKAAVRVLPDTIVPQSVHRWRTLKFGDRGYPTVEGGECDTGGGTLCGKGPGDEASESAARSFGVEESRGKSASIPASDDQRGELVNRTAMADPRELHFDELFECSDPCVLHYPSCGLDWLRDKYRMLGSFPSSWFGGKLPIAPCFHLDARNAMGDTASHDRLARGDAEGDGSRELYRKEVMLCPDEFSEEMRLQLEHGVLRVITGPASVIEAALNARGSARSMVTPAILSAQAASQAVGAVAGKTGSSEDACALVGESAPVDGGEPGAQSSSTVLNAAGDGQLPTVGSERNALAGVEEASGVDNSWILAACAREFL